jgi:hypothetical protein
MKEIIKPRPLNEVMKPVGGFSVSRKGDFITFLTLNKRAVALNHSDKPVKTHLGDIAVPTQDFLKALYDSCPENAQLVKPPKGYKAEWSKFQ